MFQAFYNYIRHIFHVLFFVVVNAILKFDEFNMHMQSIDAV